MKPLKVDLKGHSLKGISKTNLQVLREAITLVPISMSYRYASSTNVYCVFS